MAYDNNNVHQWHFRHDALEAVNSFSAAGNLFFCITMICLLVIEGVFISVDRGAIDSALDMPGQSACIDGNCPNQPCPAEPASNETPITNPVTGPTNISLDHNNSGKISAFNPEMFSFCQISDELKSANPAPAAGPEIANPTATESLTPGQPSVSLAETTQPSAPTTNSTDTAITDTKEADNDENAQKEAANAQIVRKTLRSLTRAANIVIVFSIVMYCLTLLVRIQISLAGCLGGLASSTKAFFAALLATMLLLPWARSFYPEAPSMLFSFDQLITAYKSQSYEQAENFSATLYYGRFCGMWLLVLIFVILAQWRSYSASRQISNRIMEWKTVNPFNPVPAPAAVPTPQTAQPNTVATYIHPSQSDNQGPIPLE